MNQEASRNAPTSEELEQLVVLFRSGRHADLEGHARALLERHPDFGFGWKALGLALQAQGKDAEPALQRAVELEPNDARAHYNLGVAQQAGKRLEEAAASYLRAVSLKPDYAEALNNLGNIQKGLGQLDEAAASYRRALEILPDNAMLLYNLGSVLRELGQTKESITALERIVQLHPGQAEALNALGLVYMDKAQFDKALEYFQEALANRPDYGIAHKNAAVALRDAGDFAAALQHYEAALELAPDYPAAHWDLALILLYASRYGRGWQEFEWRHGSMYGLPYCKNPCLPGQILPRPSSYLPVDFEGKRFFLLNDQGIGDEVFFLRFAPELRRRGAWVAYAASPKILPLLSRSGLVDHVVASGECIADVDHTFLVTEVPLVLGMQDDDPLPPPLPLAPLPARLTDLRERLAALGAGPCMGVTWWAGTRPDAAQRSKPNYRAVPLEKLAAALKPWSGPIVVLQRDPQPGEIAAFEAALGREVHDFSWVNNDLESMLALLALLDEYVGVDNTNMYLAASVGKPCRVLLTSLPDWRWGADGEISPWFPGFRQYRQGRDGDWGEALAQLAQDLSRGDR